MTVTIHHGDCREIIATLDDNSIDAIVTDPPYELGFMGKRWDASGIAYDTGLWVECLRVLKPGGHLLAFGGTRTYHRMTAAIEDAGFEIRDSIHWLYGSGFPKSLDVSKAIEAHKTQGGSSTRQKRKAAMGEEYEPSVASGTFRNGHERAKNSISTTPPPFTPTTDAARQWEGWGTALKPAHEPIVVARKPLVGTVAANVLEHGTGALNIDGARVCRVSGDVSVAGHRTATFGTQDTMSGGDGSGGWSQNNAGRWPANLVFTHAAGCGADECTPSCAIAALDSQSGVTKDGVAVRHRGVSGGTIGPPGKKPIGTPDMGYGGSGGASRFFTVTEWDDVTPFLYTAKPSRRERNADGAVENRHPTVKPLALMRWLVRLVTPPGGTVLEPFAGSGTTLAACVLEGFDAIGCEMTDDYLPIIEGRVAWAQQQTKQDQESLFNQ